MQEMHICAHIEFIHKSKHRSKPRSEANNRQSKVAYLLTNKAKRALGTAAQNVLRHGTPRVSSPVGQRLVDSSPTGFRFPASDSVSILTGHIEQAKRVSFESSTPKAVLCLAFYTQSPVWVPLASALLSALVGLPSPGVGPRSRAPSRNFEYISWPSPMQSKTNRSSLS